MPSLTASAATHGSSKSAAWNRLPVSGHSAISRTKSSPNTGTCWCPIIVDVFLACGVNIERLRAMGIVPADKPPLGQSLAMDSTDILAWARRGRTSRKTGEEIPCKDPDAAWGHRTEKNRRSFKVSPNKRPRAKKGKSEDSESGSQDSKGEVFLGYSVNAITDANHGLPLFVETRPANASDVTLLIPDLDACLALYPTLPSHYFLGDKGYDKLENIEPRHWLGDVFGNLRPAPPKGP